MDSNLYLEDNISKYPAIELLKELDYTYISPEECMLQRGSKYQVLLKGILRNQLRKINRFEFGGVEQEFSSANIERAMDDLDEPLSDGLIKTSEKIYDALMLGKSYQETVGGGKVLSFDLKYVDWDNLGNNIFHVTEEYSVISSDGEHTARPDIVLFVNGIPFTVIECKAPHIDVVQGVEQMIRNQQEGYIPQLFKFVQIVMATNKNFVKYATTGTPKKFWSVWKEENQAFLDGAKKKYIVDRTPTVQDENIISLFTKERLMELTKYFVLFDANVKKVCRYQQYFAIKEIIRTINSYDTLGNRQSGVIWHTQGSGKSLTMVMLAKYILLEMGKLEPRVVIVTDRKELDKQIAKTFTHTRCKPARASSGKNLIDIIHEGKADIITTIINKFNTVENSGLKMPGRDIFVLVDESHRSNYGELATKMRVVFPNACYIGFTGTPLMKNEKNTMTKFGKLIHKYTIKNGVDDKAIVPLIYEGKFVEQKVDEENIDLWFEQTTKKLNNKQKIDLKKKWSSMKHLASTEARIKRIALDVNNHFIEGYKETGFNAMLATNRKRDAVSYLACFEQFGDLRCEVCISAPDMRESVDDFYEGTDDKVIAYWNKMMKGYGDADTYEDSIKNRFIDREIDILIVCSKFLTGFDAPLCQVLYIDKELKEHGLLQAIARTNRLYDGKDYGLIVDYRGLIQKLDDAMNMYSGAGLENFEAGDLKGTIVDILSVVGKLRQSFTRLDDLFFPVMNKKDTEGIEVFLADDKKREEFYNLLCEFGKSLSVVLNSEKAYENMPKDERIHYHEVFTFYSKVRRSVKIRYNDAIDNSEYEQQMQNLLDTHMSVVGLKRITDPVDILNQSDLEKELEELGTLRSKADAIHSKMTKSISEKYDENPAYYDSFSKRIKDTLQLYKEKIITDAEYLTKMRSIMADYAAGVSDVEYPEKLKYNVHAQAFYGVIGAILNDEIDKPSNAYMVANGISYQAGTKQTKQDLIADIAIEITNIIEKHSMVDWSNNKTVHDRIAQDIDDLFYIYECTGKFKLPFEVIDKVIENVKTTALRRFKG
ncbi:type I restriction endonuclease subunit R [Lachnoclostridium sp.]|uniref:type I restriction endonuclease subunit R n=1 Tax=Lachnoclostridium sp. TaxID=2028282 RepID=UPI00289F26AF|nr:type I restriction endonuclease subunit R [Lachnoclostridium sp.]